jgi:hypothetical protein
MSFRAVAWAWDQRLAPTHRMVLMALADRMNQTSGRCDPSVGTIADDAMMSVRSVQDTLNHLMSIGLIEIEKRENRTSQYHLKMDVRLGKSETSDGGADIASTLVQNLHPPGAEIAPPTPQILHPPGANPAPKPRNLTKEEKPRESPPISPIRAVAKTSSFEEFWARYPRKVGKDAAERAFALAIRRDSLQAIMGGLVNAHFSDDPQYQPHPATWLNQGRWKDTEPASPSDLFALTGSPKFTAKPVKRGAMGILTEKMAGRAAFEARGDPIPDEYLTLEEAIERERTTHDPDQDE